MQIVTMAIDKVLTKRIQFLSYYLTHIMMRHPSGHEGLNRPNPGVFKPYETHLHPGCAMGLTYSHHASNWRTNQKGFQTPCTEKADSASRRRHLDSAAASSTRK